ncbi:hypothetical protein DOK67_0002381 [Enterococcus sp. DIV0212c]
MAKEILALQSTTAQLAYEPDFFESKLSCLTCTC